MMPKIPLRAQEAGCWIGLDVFRPSHPTANFWQAPACIFRDEIGRLTHERAHCAYPSLLKAFEILSLNLIRQQFTTDLCHVPVLLIVILKVQVQCAWFWWWFITPINSATTSAKPCIRPTARTMLLFWICKTHMTKGTQGFGEARPPNSSTMGAAWCARQRRDEGLPREVSFHLRAVPMLQLAGHQCSSWHPFSPSQGGSDLCLAPVSHPVTSPIFWPSPTSSSYLLPSSTQTCFWAEK